MTSEKESLKHLAKDLYAFPLSIAQKRLKYMRDPFKDDYELPPEQQAMHRHCSG